MGLDKIPQIPHGYSDPMKLLNKLNSASEGYFTKRGDKRALRLFHLMSKRVPAYRDFLKKKKFKASYVKNISDFKKIPLVDKDNYLRKYPLEMLCWDGRFSSVPWVVSTTSGSTGEPFYFPRVASQDKQYAILAEIYLRVNFEIHKKSTLYIVGFPMGAWIGGLFTYDALKLLVKRGGYNLSIITPGIHKLEIIKAVKKLGHKFDQIIIGSYGPFLKDILDDGERLGVDWKKYNMGFIFSAEGFTEVFRDYVINKAGVKDSYRGTLNHYGTVDLGTMSYETPLSILARRFSVDNKGVYRRIFGDTIKLPTFTQYIPELFYFEDLDGDLVCSAFSGLPLVRYDLKDHGGVLGYSEVVESFRDEGIDLIKEAVARGIGDTIWKLPFVHVFERSDFSVSFFAFQIYPETIRKALQRKDLQKFVTGKFTMLVKFDNNQDQYFEVNVELKSGIRKSKMLRDRVREHITNQLIKESSEFRETFRQKPVQAKPRVVFWPYEDPKYFKVGTKQKWVKKRQSV